MKVYIRLYGDRLDRFFDLFANRELEIYQSKTQKIKLIIGNPKVKLHIKKLTNRRSFEEVIVSGNIPSFYYGNQHDYCISGGCLYRMDADFADELSPLMSLHSDYDGKIQLQIHAAPSIIVIRRPFVVSVAIIALGIPSVNRNGTTGSKTAQLVNTRQKTGFFVAYCAYCTKLNDA